MKASGQWVVDASVSLKWYLRDQGLAYSFVTADRKLYESAKDKLTWVVWIGDLEANP